MLKKNILPTSLAVLFSFCLLLWGASIAVIRVVVFAAAAVIVVVVAAAAVAAVAVMV